LEGYYLNGKNKPIGRKSMRHAIPDSISLNIAMQSLTGPVSVAGVKNVDAARINEYAEFLVQQ
jgi:hypothetical protein